MARRLTVTLLCLAPALVLAAPAQAGVDHLLAPESVCPNQTELDRPLRAQVRTITCMHRYARRKAGSKRLHRVRPLMRSARRKARDVRRCGFSHTACGRDAFYWFDRMGFTRGNFGIAENLAFGTGGAGAPRSMMDAWLHSDGHRRALLDPDYGQAGFAVVRGRYHGDRAQYWVAHFGYRH
jgi:uncharacterized protein YkwD